MKINFTGHSPSEREVELIQPELILLFELMKHELMNTILYGKFNYSSPTYTQTVVTKLCDNHQVDVEYEKDRVAFFEAIMDKMENPYK